MSLFFILAEIHCFMISVEAIKMGIRSGEDGKVR